MNTLRSIVMGISMLTAMPSVAQPTQAPDLFQSAPGPKSAHQPTAHAHVQRMHEAEPPQLKPAAAPTSERPAHSPSHSRSSRRQSVPADADASEATRLMKDELQQRGVDLGTAADPGLAK
jgi:hypothetical protein